MEQQITGTDSQIKKRVDFFITFYRENYARVFNFVYRTQMHQEPMTAEDITQSTFCDAWRKIDILLTHPNPTGWLMETARKKVCHQLKKDNSSKISYDDDLQEPYIETRYNALELQMIIDEVLNDEEKELFQKYFVEKNSVKMMARKENMSESAFKVKMHRIRKKMQERFKE